MHSVLFRIAARVVALALALLAGYWLVWMPWQANHVLFEVEARSRLAMNSEDPVRTAVLARSNIDALRAVAPVTKGDANYYMLYAANAKLIGDLPLSAKLYTDALTRADHRPELYYERGLVYLTMGDIDAAVADLSHAARFNPSILGMLTGELHRRVLERVQTR